MKANDLMNHTRNDLFGIAKSLGLKVERTAKSPEIREMIEKVTENVVVERANAGPAPDIEDVGKPATAPLETPEIDISNPGADVDTFQGVEIADLNAPDDDFNITPPAQLKAVARDGEQSAPNPNEDRHVASQTVTPSGVRRGIPEGNATPQLVHEFTKNHCLRHMEILQLDTETFWFKYGTHQDSGTMHQPLRRVIRCADELMRKTNRPQNVEEWDN
jgi:hypothetical protein